MLHCIYQNLSPPMISGFKDLGTASDSSLYPQHSAWSPAHTQKANFIFVHIFLTSSKNYLVTFYDYSDGRSRVSVADTLGIQKYEEGNEDHM